MCNICSLLITKGCDSVIYCCAKQNAYVRQWIHNAPYIFFLASQLCIDWIDLDRRCDGVRIVMNTRKHMCGYTAKESTKNERLTPNMPNTIDQIILNVCN